MAETSAGAQHAQRGVRVVKYSRQLQQGAAGLVGGGGATGSAQHCRGRGGSRRLLCCRQRHRRAQERRQDARLEQSGRHAGFRPTHVIILAGDGLRRLRPRMAGQGSRVG